MGRKVKAIGFHGVSKVDLDDPAWAGAWAAPAERALRAHGATLDLGGSTFPSYDRLFDARPVGGREYLDALLRLLRSGVMAGLFGGSRAFGLPSPASLAAKFRWTAGMVAQWTVDETLRARCRALVKDALLAGPHDVVLAHSLGSLLVYDTLVRERVDLGDTLLVTFGSQIGSPFVRETFGGFLPMPNVRRWIHLYNEEDHMFTARVPIRSERFEEVDTGFDEPGPLNHSVEGYLLHPAAAGSVWAELSKEPESPGAAIRSLVAGARGTGRPTREGRAAKGAATSTKPADARAPDHRALLVGIDDYPDPANRLDGCVNDTFLVSSVLQESGFRAEDIRLVLNDRATASAVRERLAWLLEDPRPGDIRFFFYSGHGAQVPAYGPEEVVDHEDEVLVTHDFDWSDPVGTGITDDALRDLYSQLPYEMTFVMMLDCCHSGGMSRAGGAKVRGLTPPDDVRHRALKWNEEFQSWVPREFESLGRRGGRRDARFFGKTGSTRRLGGAADLRRLPKREAERLGRELGHRGPYLPLILSACQESQLSYEYRHGAQSFGAFTYATTRILRRDRGEGISFDTLAARATKELEILGYEQVPELVANSAVAKQPIPWPARSGAPTAKPAGRRPRRKT